jgi:2-methylcitrate dehydratase PrpD
MAETMTAGGDGTLTEQAARYWANVQYEDLPADIVAMAKRFLLDTLAAGIAGAGTEAAQAATRAMCIGLEGATGTSVIWGQACRLPPVQAALVNGTAAHALELDDFGGCGHSGAVVIPVVSALAGRASVTGRDALVAILAGYDLSARVLDGAGGYRPVNELGWHSTGTCGSFGAAAAAARLLGLDQERFADALGIAGSFTGGIWAYLVDGAMTKRLHPGKAAETGLTAALLAASGMSGPRHVLETEWGGFFSTYSPGIATPELTLHGLGEEFGIIGCGMKPYACCRGIHASIDALLALMREMEIGSTSISGIFVHGDAQTHRQFNRQQIGSLLDAQFSMPYTLAIAAESGRATIDQYQPLRLHELEVRRLMQATKVIPDRVLKGEESPPLELHLTDGRRLERQIAFAKGAPENPLTDQELHDKVESLIVPVLGPSRCREIIAAVRSLEVFADCRDFLELLAGQEQGREAA